MGRVLKRIVRPVAGVLMLAFAVVLSANCLTGAQMTESQMACCTTMSTECGHRAPDMSCCPTESQQVDQVAAAVKRIVTPLPDATFTPAGVVLAPAPYSRVARGHDFDGSAPKPPGVPKYLLASTLLI